MKSPQGGIYNKHCMHDHYRWDQLNTVDLFVTSSPAPLGIGRQIRNSTWKLLIVGQGSIWFIRREERNERPESEAPQSVRWILFACLLSRNQQESQNPLSWAMSRETRSSWQRMEKQRLVLRAAS